MVTLAVLEQPPGVVAVTVYVVVFIGDAATGFEVVELKPVPGVQRKVYPAPRGPAEETEVPVKVNKRFLPVPGIQVTAPLPHEVQTGGRKPPPGFCHAHGLPVAAAPVAPHAH
jgi:hypothetical protein